MRKRGPPKSVTPPVPITALTAEEELELDYYVCCCIEEIENILLKNSSEKQKKLAEVSLKILKNPAETVIKKKQVMRQWFDDYKKKFESKKRQTVMSLYENKCIIKKPEMPSESVFFRKHKVKNEEPVMCKSETCKNSNLGDENMCSFKPSDNSFKFAFQT